MRNDFTSIAVGFVMLLVGIGIGYILAMRTIGRDLERMVDNVLGAPVEEPAAPDVRVVAKQFSWHFHYPGPDGVFGITEDVAITDANPIGLDREDPDAADDICSAELVLPCDEDIVLGLHTADVIHALGHLDGADVHDAIPGVSVRVPLRVPATPKSGRLRCVQLCGAGHEHHHAPYRYVPAEAFAAWKAAQTPWAREQGSAAGIRDR